MKIILAFLALALALAAFVQAADPDFNTVPACAATCVKAALASNTTCTATDTTCLCQDKVYNAAVVQCVTASCTVKEGLVATRFNARACGVPIRSRSVRMMVIRAVFMSLTTFFVAVKLYVRITKLGGKWWWDDYTVLLAYLVAIGFLVDNIFVTKHGLGVDIWDLSFYDITKWFWTFYIIAILYKFQMSLAKISVCLFFLRIFPARSFRRYAFIVIALNAITGIMYMCLDAFQCMPIRAAWEGWAKEFPAKCIDFPAVALSNGIVNILLDVGMLSLPIYEVTKLNLTRRKKINIAVMFSMGFILTIVGILRSEQFSRHLKTTNPTVDMEGLHYWSLIECDLSVICACIPDLRVFLIGLFPNLFRSAAKTTPSSSKGATYTFGGSGMPSRSNNNNNMNNNSRSNKNNISMTTSYAVEYSTKSHSEDEESFVQLVDLDSHFGSKKSASTTAQAVRH